MNSNESLDKLDIQGLILQMSYDFLSADISNIDSKIQSMLQMTGEFFDVERTYVFFYNENYTLINNTHEWCSENIHSVKDQNQDVEVKLFPWWHSSVHKAILNLEPFLLESLDHLPDEAVAEKQILLQQSVKSMYLIPISKRNKVIGFFGLDSVHREKSWGTSDVSLLSVIGNILSVVLTKNQSEKDLIEARKLAEEANRAKSLFLANMSHEIRTPLNSIIGFTNLLKESILTSEQYDYINYTNRSAVHLKDIVNDILDFSKIEAGKMELDIQKVDILTIIEDIVSVSKLEAMNKKLEFSFIHDGFIPRFVYLDPLRIKQILINLVSNAIKFTQEGFVRIRLQYDSVNPEKQLGSFLFSIEDSGIGIPLDQQKKLFRTFSQADISTTRKYGGTGLGLVISSKLADLMNSSIIVHSEEGKGSIFYFSLKAKYERLDFETDSKFFEHSANESQNAVTDTIQKTILIVEDVEVNLILLKAILSRIFPRCKILEANNGEEAVIKFNSHSPDLIIMDIQMPIKDGYQATKEIRYLEKQNPEKFPKPIPIIALTAGALLEEKQQSFEVGMNDFCTKPINKEEIKNILYKFLKPNQ